MADIVGAISALNDVEIAADAPVTEAVFSKIGANINELILGFCPVGTVVMTLLTEFEFQTEMGGGTEWRLADGSSAAGTRYNTITGQANLPDMRGVFPRGKNHLRSTSTGDSAGDRSLVSYQADALLQHQHSDSLHNHDQVVHTGNINHNVASGPAGNNTVVRPPGAGPDFGLFSNVLNNSSANISNVSGAPATSENIVRNVCVNYMIRVN